MGLPWKGGYERGEWAHMYLTAPSKFCQLHIAPMLNMNSSERISEQASKPMPEMISTNKPRRAMHRSVSWGTWVHFCCVCTCTCISFPSRALGPRMGTFLKITFIVLYFESNKMHTFQVYSLSFNNCMQPWNHHTTKIGSISLSPEDLPRPSQPPPPPQGNH